MEIRGIRSITHGRAGMMQYGAAAVRMSNVDVGARTIEIAGAEYIVRGLGFIKSVEDLERTVVAVHDNVPIYVRHIGDGTSRWPRSPVG